MVRGPRLRLCLALLLVLLVPNACSAPEAPSISHLEQSLNLGVPENGFPSWDERVILVLTNRARADPAAECAGSCTAYPATKPLTYQANAGRAARFQSTSLVLAKAGLMHDSVCQLVSNLGSLFPASCDGSPSCACQTAPTCTCSGSSPYCTVASGSLTAWNSRISLFGASAAGENLAAGSSDPISSFSQWVHSSGHWTNINGSGHAKIGTGYFAGTGGCWNNIWAQVFSGGAAAADVLFGGAHYPKSGTTTTSFKFWANYAAAAAPQLATVNIDGTCYPMTLERGTATSGTYLVQQTVPASGCHRYYFYFRDGSGALTSYPTVGSYGVGVGATCSDYSATERPAPGAGCGGCTVDADCDDKNACTQDTCSGGQCKSTAIAGCCTAAAQCDDGNVCTQDACSANKCSSAPITGCCTSAAQCDDGNACTTDSCSANKCQHAAVAGCCASVADCDDKDPCTQDACSASKCQHTALSGCCSSPAACDDGSSCTVDTCVANKCAFTAVPGCCTKDADCGTSDACTQRLCQTGTCQLVKVPGCCSSDVDCVDADACTQDSCSANKCEHAPIAGCGVVREAGPTGQSDAGVGGNGGNGGTNGGTADAGVEHAPPSNIGFSPDDVPENRLNGGCSLAQTPQRPCGSALPLTLPLPLLVLGLVLGVIRLRRPRWYQR